MIDHLRGLGTTIDVIAEVANHRMSGQCRRDVFLDQTFHREHQIEAAVNVAECVHHS
jgi:hypothetical protein